MKNVFTKLTTVAAFCGMAASMSCGTEADDAQTRLDATVESLLEVNEEGLAPRRGGETSEECKKINARVSKHGRAMARTKAFKAMIRTQAYKDLAKDVVEMKRKGCSMSPGGGGEGGMDFECLSLQIKAYQHQQVLMGTAEYKALAKTRAYKRFQKDIEEAQKKGCIKMEVEVMQDL